MAGNSGNVLQERGLPIAFAMGAVDLRALPPPNDRLGQSVRVWARSLSVMQKEAIVLSALTAKAWRLASDEGPYLDGFDAAPCPLSFLGTGMASSYMNEILALARERRVALRDLVLVQDNFYTMEGSAVRGTMIGGALPVELEIQIDADAADDVLRELVADAVHASPVNGLLRGVHPSLFSTRLNGRHMAIGDIGAIVPLGDPDPGVTLRDALTGTERADSQLIERLAAVESVEGVAGGAHTSLSETQSRTLHLRAICTLRPDGVKEIEQHLFNPRGSTFRFLSDEAEGFGGRGAAPDAASYMAAGIAFCFMTQLGRYASIVKRSLDAYNVIQDAHFSLGGASGSTGQPGRADPLETHVYLTSPEDDAFARKVVVMGEQTCFLHALCRTDLKTKIRITRAVLA
jgi:organic hydroperoxide reductase OsmC/OhrA